MKPTRTVAFLDELVKIAEEAPKKKPWVKDVAKGILAAGLGSGLGYGAGMLLERAFPKALAQHNPQYATAMKIILPILGGAAFYLGDRYRRRRDEEFSKAPGWVKPK